MKNENQFWLKIDPPRAKGAQEAKRFGKQVRQVTARMRCVIAKLHITRANQSIGPAAFKAHLNISSVTVLSAMAAAESGFCRALE